MIREHVSDETYLMVEILMLTNIIPFYDTKGHVKWGKVIFFFNSNSFIPLQP